MISGRQEFFFLAVWWAGYFFPFFPIIFLLQLCCMQLFSSDKRLQDFFFQNHPPPPEELNGRPLSCLVPQLVHYGHVVQTKILGKRRTRGTNQEQANMAEKSVDGKGFVFFTEVFVRIQVYPSKGKRTIKKGA